MWGQRKGDGSERLGEGLIVQVSITSQMILEIFRCLEGVLTHSLTVLYQPTIVLVFS